MEKISSRKQHRSSRGYLFPALLASVFGVLIVTALSAMAADTAQFVQNGTLKLTQASSTNPASGGFTTEISAIAPGDTVNRYITLTNGGTENAGTMTLGLTDSLATALTTDGTIGLQVAVNACSIAWGTVTAGVCSGTTTLMMSSKAALLLTQTPQILTLPAGATAAGSTMNLQISLSLPESNEVTVNGVLPVGTVQGLTSSLVWTFTETLRTTTPTNNY